MGMPMMDIHAPSVAFGERSDSDLPHGVASDKSSLMELIAEKDRVDSELRALSSVLKSHGVNMNTSLTTFDGYPRDDLDIAQIRTTRSRIIYLRNDYKGLMSRIEAGLHAHHASAQSDASLTNSSNTGAGSSAPLATSSSSDGLPPGVIETPFAKVNSVVAGSPAEDAGLKAGDEIRRFGSVNWTNHEKLSKIAEAVQRSEGQPISVTVRRINRESQTPENLQLQLTPRRDWGGRGMLGCHLLPA